MYTRIGLYPNLGVCWVTAFICGPGRPAVAIVDFAAPLPAGEELTLECEGLRAEHVCMAALERFRVRVEATGEAYAGRSRAAARRVRRPSLGRLRPGMGDIG